MAITIRNTLNPELKVATGVANEYDIIYPKTTASNIGVAGSEQGNYSTSRQFVTGAMLDKLGLTVNSANSFLTLDALGKIDIDLIPTDAFLTELEAVPYDDIKKPDPVNGDLIVYKNGEIAYMPQSALAISTAMQTALNNKLNTSLKGVASGLAELDSNGRVPLAQINDSLIGQVEYMGTWNASTNSPTLPATPTEKGQYYITSVAGTQFSKSFEVGDWIIASGTTDSLYWDKVDNTDAVSSVAGKTGVVTLVKGDVGLGNVDNTSDLDKPVSTAQQTALNDKVEKIAGKGLSTNDYDNTEKNKVSGIATGAQVNVIETVQVNGTDLTIYYPTTSKTVNVTRTLVGANKTFIGSTAPVGAIEGDLWFDTSVV